MIIPNSIPKKSVVGDFGILINSGETFARLIDHLDKAQNRGDEIMVSIK